MWHILRNTSDKCTFGSPQVSARNVLKQEGQNNEEHNFHVSEQESTTAW